MIPRLVAGFATLALLLSARPAGAVNIDGRLDVEYGAALITQTTQTGDNDNDVGKVDYSWGSELDGGYGYVANGVLYLFLSGNSLFRWTIEAQTVWLPVDVFIDSRPGGQNQLLSNNPSPDSYFYNVNQAAGLTFDSGFEADYWLSLGGNSNIGSWPMVMAYEGELPTAGGGAGEFLGSTACGGPGTLSGGTNPFGIQATVDESNVAGVTHGCGASSGAGVITGIEWAIPLVAIGNPTGCIKVCAYVGYGDHSGLLNQVLGPLPPGTCNLGAASSANFASIDGDQFFSVCPTANGVPGPPPQGLTLLGAEPNPSRGDRVLVTFALPDSRPAMLQLIDSAGRVVRERAVVGSGGAGTTTELSGGRRLAPGLYWLRLSQGRTSVTRKVCVVR